MIDITDRPALLNADYGFLYGLPKGIIYTYYGQLISFGNTEIRDIRGLSEKDVINFIKKSEYINNKLVSSKGVIDTYEKLNELIKKNKSLFQRYFIKELECGIKDCRFYIKIEFDCMDHEKLFGYYYRTNCNYNDKDVADRMINKILRLGEDGVKKYEEWCAVAQVFRNHHVDLDWFRYFKLDGGKLILKGKGWNETWVEIGKKLVDLSQKRKGSNDWVLDYDGLEPFDVLLNLLEG